MQLCKQHHHDVFGRPVPAKGWRFVLSYDYEEEVKKKGALTQCQLCGSYRVRYVCVVENPDFVGKQLEIGCICLQWLVDKQTLPPYLRKVKNPKYYTKAVEKRCERIKELKKHVKNRLTHLRPSRNGNPTVKTDIGWITIIKDKYDRFKIVYGTDCGKHYIPSKGIGFPTKQAAVDSAPEAVVKCYFDDVDNIDNERGES